MLDYLHFPFFNFPIARSSAGWANAQLSVHAPMLRKAFVFGVVEDGNVRQIAAAFNLQAHVHPTRALAFGFFVFLPRGVHHFALHTFFPRHSHKQAAVVVFTDCYVGLGFARPFQI